MKYGDLDSKTVADAQRRLRQLGHGPRLVPDGIAGPLTRRAVEAFQRANGLRADGNLDAATLAALAAPAALTRELEFLMIHCTATRENSPHWNAAAVVRLHTREFGWRRPGYSKVVEYDGRVVDTWPLDLSDGWQPDWEMTNGAAAFNPRTVHVCYVGGLSAAGEAKDTRTPRQMLALADVVRGIVAQAPDIRVGGHNQYHNKACPCFWVPRWLDGIGVDARNIYEADPFGYAKAF